MTVVKRNPLLAAVAASLLTACAGSGNKPIAIPEVAVTGSQAESCKSGCFIVVHAKKEYATPQDDGSVTTSSQDEIFSLICDMTGNFKGQASGTVTEGTSKRNPNGSVTTVTNPPTAYVAKSSGNADTFLSWQKTSDGEGSVNLYPGQVPQLEGTARLNPDGNIATARQVWSTTARECNAVQNATSLEQARTAIERLENQQWIEATSPGERPTNFSATVRVMPHTGPVARPN